MRYLDPLVKVGGFALGLLIGALLLVGCNTSTEPTVQMKFPEGMKLPEPAKGPVVVPGTGVMSQGNPLELSK
jgi:hypothetical protein